MNGLFNPLLDNRIAAAISRLAKRSSQGKREPESIVPPLTIRIVQKTVPF